MNVLISLVEFYIVNKFIICCFIFEMLLLCLGTTIELNYPFLSLGITNSISTKLFFNFLFKVSFLNFLYFPLYIHIYSVLDVLTFQLLTYFVLFLQMIFNLISSSKLSLHLLFSVFPSVVCSLLLLLIFLHRKNTFLILFFIIS